jgi:hypothetical protein
MFTIPFIVAEPFAGLHVASPDPLMWRVPPASTVRSAKFLVLLPVVTVCPFLMKTSSFPSGHPSASEPEIKFQVEDEFQLPDALLSNVACPCAG